VAATPSIAGLVLTAGSGGLANHQTLIDIDEQLSAQGVAVLRYDFEYRRAGKRSPGRADRLVGEMTETIEAFAARLGVATNAIAAGGRSMGGRVCTMAAAAGLELGGLVLLSYPLHPPAKPDRLRVDHWPDVSAPALFISSDSDPFGRPSDFAEHLHKWAGPVKTLWLSGGGHDPKRIAHRAAIVETTESWLTQLSRN